MACHRRAVRGETHGDICSTVRPRPRFRRIPGAHTLVTETADQPSAMRILPVREDVQHHQVQVLREPQLLEAVVPEELAQHLGQAAPACLRCLAREGPATIGGQCDRSSAPSPGGAGARSEPAKRDGMRVLHASIIAVPGQNCVRRCKHSADQHEGSPTGGSSENTSPPAGELCSAADVKGVPFGTLRRIPASSATARPFASRQSQWAHSRAHGKSVPQPPQCRRRSVPDHVVTLRQRQHQEVSFRLAMRCAHPFRGRCRPWSPALAGGRPPAGRLRPIRVPPARLSSSTERSELLAERSYRRCRVRISGVAPRRESWALGWLAVRI